MKRYGIYALIALLGMVSCHRQGIIPSKDRLPDITFSVNAEEVQSKGYISSATLNSNGTVVRVYDYLTGFTGTFDNTDYDSGNLMYINGKDLVYNSSDGLWDFASGELWQWTRTGTHNFFGFLTEDHSVNPALTSANLWDDENTDIYFNTATRSFSIPQVTFTTETSQFDLCYSDWVSVASASRTGDHVSLPLKHAFMALSVTIANTSDDGINLKSVSIKRMVNKKSATFGYGDTAPTYADKDSTAFLATWDGEKALDKGDKIDLLTGGYLEGTLAPSPAPAPKYILMWPQTEAEVDDIRIVIEYTIDNVWDPDEPWHLLQYTKSLPLKDAGLQAGNGTTLPMSAGTRYNLALQFKGRSVDLTLTAMEWKMEYLSIDYSSSAILANSTKANDGVLWLYNHVWDPQNSIWKWEAGNRNRQITMTNDCVQGQFHILSPTSGEWRITTYPADAAQYFRLDPSDGNIEDLYVNDEFIGDVVFYIYPVGQVPTTKVVHFNVDIRMNGSWRNANTEFNRKDWQLTREP